MSFLSEYAGGIITVSVLAILLENLLPGGHYKKYISMVIGLLVMLVIIRPLAELPHYKDTFAVPMLHIKETDFVEAKPYVAEVFEQKLARSVMETVRKELGIAVACRVCCDVNADGAITAVRHVYIEPCSRETVVFVSEKYGIEEAQISS